MQRCLAVILGGGRGERLFPLTKYRSKPAVPLGGKYRLIDIPVSNCLNSGLTRVFVLTQFNSASLNRHLTDCYRFDHFSSAFVEVLAAQQTMEHMDWYQGTADAVRQQLHQFEPRRMDHLVILSGDHLYRMDYRPFLQTHLELQADVTVGATPIPLKEANRFGVLTMDQQGVVTDFVEKPPKPTEYAEWCVPPPEGSKARHVLASMGIYIFRWPVLRDLLVRTAHRDFGSEVFPSMLSNGCKVAAYRFDGYWADIGTIQSFFEANLALTQETPRFSFYQADAPVYSNPRFLPPTKMEHCEITRCLVSDGVILREAMLEDSVIGVRSIIGSGTHLRRAIIMGADFYEKRDRREPGLPPVGIGPKCVIENAIVDKNARIGTGVRITNAAGVREHIGDHYCIRDGIVVIPKGAVLPSGTVI